MDFMTTAIWPLIDLNGVGSSAVVALCVTSEKGERLSSWLLRKSTCPTQCRRDLARDVTMFSSRTGIRVRLCALNFCMTTFVLLHGNWHMGSAWDGVSRRLKQLGHIAHTPTLPGHGQHGATSVGYQEAGEAVAGYIVERDLRDIVLVGHSGGGVAISKAVELIAERVERLVYLSGWVLKDGESILEMVPAHYRELFISMAADSPNNTVEAPLEQWRRSFINDGDDATAKSAFAQLVPEPFSYFAEPVNFTTFHTLTTIPKSYILPTEDVVLPRDDVWGWHPRMTSRLGQHRFLEMPGSHEVMFTNPQGLADTIIEACID